MQLLEIVVGLIFILLLYSLFATTVMELIASIFKLRGRNLEKAIKNMLSDSTIDDDIYSRFKNNSLFQQLGYRFGKAHRPSYLQGENFQSILFDVLLKGEEISLESLEAKIEELPNDNLRNVLKQLLNDAKVKSEDTLTTFRTEVKGWYNAVMDRASGWYKRSTHKILIGIGMAIAIIFNADTISIFSSLEKDPETLQQIVSLAEQFVEDNDSTTLDRVDPEFEQSYEAMKQMINNELESVNSPLGLGWQNVNVSTMSVYDWFAKVIGWIITALAISLGAPFWFDLLRKMVNLRSSGSKPEE